MLWIIALCNIVVNYTRSVLKYAAQPLSLLRSIDPPPSPPPSPPPLVNHLQPTVPISLTMDIETFDEVDPFNFITEECFSDLSAVPVIPWERKYLEQLMDDTFNTNDEDLRNLIIIVIISLIVIVVAFIYTQGEQSYRREDRVEVIPEKLEEEEEEKKEKQEEEEEGENNEEASINGKNGVDSDPSLNQSLLSTGQDNPFYPIGHPNHSTSQYLETKLSPSTSVSHLMNNFLPGPLPRVYPANLIMPDKSNINFADDLKIDINHYPVLNSRHSENLSIKDIPQSKIDILKPPMILKSAVGNVEQICNSSHSFGRLQLTAYALPETQISQVNVISRVSLSAGSDHSVEFINQSDVDLIVEDYNEYDESFSEVKDGIYEKFTSSRGSSTSTKISESKKFVLNSDLLELLKNNDGNFKDNFDDFFNTIEDYQSISLNLDIEKTLLGSEMITAESIERKFHDLFILINIPTKNQLNQIKFIGKLRYFITMKYEGSDDDILNIIKVYQEFMNTSFDRFVEVLAEFKNSEDSRVSQHLILLIRDFIKFNDSSNAKVGANSFSKCLSLLFEILELNTSLKEVICSSLLSIITSLDLKTFKTRFLTLFEDLFSTNKISFKQQILSLEGVIYYLCINRIVIVEEFNNTPAYESKLDCCGYKIIESVHKCIKSICHLSTANEKQPVNISSQVQSSLYGFAYELVDLYLVILEVFLKSSKVPSSTQAELLTIYINEIYEDTKVMVSFDSRTLQPPKLNIN
ncbi:uncharacterized protein RJT21DRAFT_122845 [Scheffersomyces amazonensis]|uniref:uncharacterized protein n=1 Tax=Scheffersomyces amazonensis TaxID=1078765 RepID=UPI00315D2D55